ncbi:MAG TPA: CoA ester lyase [Luteibacter sp.]|jgi:citrate lyase subunit beta/citryl-CoA lyase/(S)-citramalyl-CoA lyase|nr:CoA ester lyase [Luteibacter sp.]
MNMDVSYLNTSVQRFDPTLPDPGFGADIVILDLEDSVHAQHKGEAREAFVRLDLSRFANRKPGFGIRINSIKTRNGLLDLCAVIERLRGDGGLSFIQLPKAESRSELELCRAVLNEAGCKTRLIPIIETPRGVDHVEDISGASDAMMFGRVDMEAAMYRPNSAYINYARARFCVACAGHGIAAIDTAGFRIAADIMDLDRFERECVAGRAEGFTAKAMVHPAQIAVVKRVFTQDEAQFDAWRETIADYARANVGFSVVDGRVVAPPFVAHAHAMLRLYAVT